MRVCFVLPEIGASGGSSVVLGHAARLSAAGHADTDVAVLSDPSFDACAAREYDVVVATWWTTAAPSFTISARRRTVLLQGLDERFYAHGELRDRLAAASILCLPLRYMAVGDWLARTVAAIRPDTSCLVVPNGIDKAVFAPRGRRRRKGPLRVLIDGQPELPIKGVQEAVAAVKAMRQPVTATVFAPAPQADRLDGVPVVGGLEPVRVADLYADHDVLLKLSRSEGLGLPALEALHMGLPCVVTPYGGHEDYLRDGENGLLVPFGDVNGTARTLDRLALDGALLERLGEGAAETTSRWPDPAASTALLAEALERILGDEPPPCDPAVREQLALVGRAHALLGAETDGLRGALDWNESALEAARAEVEELNRSRQHCAEMLDDARRKLREIEASQVYRLVTRAQRVKRRVRP